MPSAENAEGRTPDVSLELADEDRPLEVEVGMKPVLLLEDNLPGFDVDEENPKVDLGWGIGDADKGPGIGRQKGL
ncbi:hypothetical protein [Tunturiibacter gelidiferens]|uniref:Uncharacterized protein n=1 Tax=Tunturiibacter gelidiferens TaxID=3069689 RepID=A0AAU7Z0S6_9BACT